MVIAYEDFKAAEKAKEVYDFLVANFTHEWRVSSQMWKFAVLDNPELRKMAAKDAATASLIIVSARGDQELPADVKAWIEAWLGCQDEGVALIALFDSPPGAAGHVQADQAYLENVARRGRMEFFAWPSLEAPAASADEGNPPDHSRDRVEQTRTPPAAALRRAESFAHWGINE